MKTKLFLSNSEIIDNPFLDFCERHQIALLAKPLIGFEAVAHDNVPDAEVVFFSSPRSVDFFVHSMKTTTWKFACLGEGTAKRLVTYGYTPDFIGSNSGNPEKVANEFIKWLGTRKVIFPVSSKSNRSIASVVPADQRTELIVYQTIAVPEPVEPCQIYVFTSPSNVDAFLEKNRFPDKSRVVAWGNTTAKRLLDLGIRPSFVLQQSDLRHLEQFLQQ